jgi:hypothetical protein
MLANIPGNVFITFLLPAEKLTSAPLLLDESTVSRDSVVVNVPIPTSHSVPPKMQ